MNRRSFMRGCLAATFVARRQFKPFGRIDSPHFDVERVSDSVFAVRGKPGTGIPTNSALIVGEDAVAIVDAHQRPSFDREVIAIVERITDRPIRYLVNTHWHQDHTLGNQAFEPFAEIIAHESTKEQMLNRVTPNIALQRKALPEQQKRARQALANSDDANERTRLAQQIDLDEEYLKELPSIRVTPPSRVFADSYSMRLSDRPVELRHLGLAHTRGDILAHLPHEGTVILGDLVTAGQPFMRRNDAVPREWSSTLRKVAALPWDRAVIGHGSVGDVRGRIAMLTEYLDTLVAEVSRVADLPADRVVAAVLPRLAQFAQHFPYFEQAVVENILRTHESLSN